MLFIHVIGILWSKVSIVISGSVLVTEFKKGWYGHWRSRSSELPRFLPRTPMEIACWLRYTHSLLPWIASVSKISRMVWSYRRAPAHSRSTHPVEKAAGLWLLSTACASHWVNLWRHALTTNMATHSQLIHQGSIIGLAKVARNRQAIHILLLFLQEVRGTVVADIVRKSLGASCR